jgi:hypothetical protein
MRFLFAPVGSKRRTYHPLVDRWFRIGGYLTGAIIEF